MYSEEQIAIKHPRAGVSSSESHKGRDEKYEAKKHVLRVRNAPDVVCFLSFIIPYIFCCSIVLASTFNIAIFLSALLKRRARVWLIVASTRNEHERPQQSFYVHQLIISFAPPSNHFFFCPYHKSYCLSIPCHD